MQSSAAAGERWPLGLDSYQREIGMDTAVSDRWLNILKAGQFPVDTITTDDFKVRTYSGTAIITGRSAYYYGGKKLGEVRHTQVWANPNGRWQLVSWQGTSVPSEASHGMQPTAAG